MYSHKSIIVLNFACENIELEWRTSKIHVFSIASGLKIPKSGVAQTHTYT